MVLISSLANGISHGATVLLLVSKVSESIIIFIEGEPSCSAIFLYKRVLLHTCVVQQSTVCNINSVFCETIMEKLDHLPIFSKLDQWRIQKSQHWVEIKIHSDGFKCSPTVQLHSLYKYY